VILSYVTPLELSVEKEYSERLAQQAGEVAELTLQLEQLQAEKHKLTDQLEAKLIDTTNKYVS